MLSFYHTTQNSSLSSSHDSDHGNANKHTSKSQSIEPSWYPLAHKSHSVDSQYLPWLLDNSSLTKKLINKSHGRFRVSVLDQRIRQVPFSERHALQIPNRQWAVIREVVLYGNNTPWVYARTVIPLHTLHGPLRRLHYLGNKPLGEQLFTDSTMERGPIHVARFLPKQIPQQACKHSIEWASTWGRRSVFRLSNKPLLVSEVFLPALLTP